jgi:hypothetical protein
MSTSFEFLPETHSYIENGVTIPSVTQCLGACGLVCYDHVPADILQRKAELGTAAHAACHYADEGDLSWESVDHAVLPYVTAWMKFRNECDFAPKLLEFRGIGEVGGMKYGYTLDREGLFNGRDSIIEIKCTASVEVSWGPQTAAYELARRKIDGKVRSRVAVHLKPSGTYSLVKLDDVNDYRVFQWALGLESWKRAKGKRNVNDSNHNG